MGGPLAADWVAHFVGMRSKTLRGIIPICAGCKKVRDDTGFWEQVEVYISRRSSAQFSHGMCPQCFEEYYGELGIDYEEVSTTG